MKRALKGIAIGYFAIGLLYNAVMVFPQKYGWRAFTMSPYQVETNGGLAETVFWPLYVAGVLPLKEATSRSQRPSP